MHGTQELDKLLVRVYPKVAHQPVYLPVAVLRVAVPFVVQVQLHPPDHRKALCAATMDCPINNFSIQFSNRRS